VQADELRVRVVGGVVWLASALAVPPHVYKRRYDVYCPTNVIDLAERSMSRK
jgi:hypothetical protein